VADGSTVLTDAHGTLALLLGVLTLFECLPGGFGNGSLAARRVQQQSGDECHDRRDDVVQAAPLVQSISYRTKDDAGYQANDDVQRARHE
jgi:hypothetical protein